MPQVFEVDQAETTEEYLIESILEASILKLNVEGYVGHPCLRFEFGGEVVDHIPG